MTDFICQKIKIVYNMGVKIKNLTKEGMFYEI